MMTRSEVLRALQAAHGGAGHRVFQGGNFYNCDTCRLHIIFRGQALTWVPPRARKERAITTLEAVAATVR